MSDFLALGRIGHQIVQRPNYGLFGKAPEKQHDFAFEISVSQLHSLEKQRNGPITLIKERFDRFNITPGLLENTFFRIEFDNTDFSSFFERHLITQDCWTTREF